MAGSNSKKPRHSPSAVARKGSTTKTGNRGGPKGKMSHLWKILNNQGVMQSRKSTSMSGGPRKRPVEREL